MTESSRSLLMSRVKQQGTKPEMAVRSVPWSIGARYRVNAGSLPGSPDISNKTKKKAIFVHGCFWHAHPGCDLATLPKSNTEFWKNKFDRNRERDRRKKRQLEEMGFDVLVVWSCELEEPGLESRLAHFWFGNGQAE